MIVTETRIKQASLINRWQGATTRPFSILEHSLIGAKLIEKRVGRTHPSVKRFLVHDLHETEILGDLPSPQISKYTNEAYSEDVTRFDELLKGELSLGNLWWRDPLVTITDKLARDVEHGCIVTMDRGCGKPEHPTNALIVQGMIMSQAYADRDVCITEWWKMFDGE